MDRTITRSITHMWFGGEEILCTQITDVERINLKQFGMNQSSSLCLVQSNLIEVVFSKIAL